MSRSGSIFEAEIPDNVVDLIDRQRWPSVADPDIGEPPPGFYEWGAYGVAAPHPRAAIMLPEDFAPEPFIAPLGSQIPRRRYVGGLYSYPRGVVTALVGVGGSAKSILTLAEALALASGKPLLGVECAPARVWVINLEDPLHELQRRLVAAMQHFGLRQEDIADRLMLTSGMGKQPFITATQARDGAVIHEPVYDAITAHIHNNAIDALDLDPFVSSHRVLENDNGAVDAVAKRWSHVADDTQSCIQLIHHLRKLGGREATAEDARGAGSLSSAARLVRVVNGMTEDEAEKAGIPDERWRYFRTTDGKANLTPRSDKSTWHRLESVRLDNGTLEGPGDSVGVVTPWKWPDAFEGISLSDLRRVHAALADGEWKLDTRGKGTWAGVLIGRVCGIDITLPAGKNQAQSMLRTWIERGALLVQKRRDSSGNYRDLVVQGDISETIE